MSTACSSGRKTGSAPVPLEPLGAVRDPVGDRLALRFVWGLIALGIAARLIRYLLRFPLWQDEAYLAVNFLDRDFAELTGPLDNRQVAPLLFLWAQHIMVQCFGFTEYTLRLFPLLCGVGALLLFRHLAGLLLRGTALVLAVGFLAVAYPAIRYSVEAKQYSCDLLASMVLLTLAVQWWRRPDRARWLWALVLLVPLAMGFSFPAVFTAGGIGLAVACRSWQTGASRRVWLAWLCYGVVLVAAFGGVYALSAANQSNNARQFLVQMWGHLFPPLDSPWRFLVWLASTHTSDMAAYPFGGAHGGSVLTFLCCVVALVVLFRRGHGALASLLLSPLALNFLAACLRRYVYGGPVRFSIYFAPVVCILGGLGAAIVLLAGKTHRRAARLRLGAVLLLLAALAVGSIGRDLYKPYKNEQVRRARDVAMAVWRDGAESSEPVGLLTDLGNDFSTGRCPTVLALYLCNQRIYSQRLAEGRKPSWARISTTRPLALVHFVSPPLKQDHAALARWLEEEVESRYLLLDCEKWAAPITYDNRPLAERVDVYRFVPRPTRCAHDRALFSPHSPPRQNSPGSTQVH